MIIKDDNKDSDKVKTLDKNFEEKYFKGKLLYIFFTSMPIFRMFHSGKKIALWFFSEDYK